MNFITTNQNKNLKRRENVLFKIIQLFLLRIRIRNTAPRTQDFQDLPVMV